ncbi:MAG: DUF4907 domain-containing protein [Bacteroidales bacterium]|nr:DUF4907 domain-containing protein [Bacteroidales bacterium]
MRRLITSSLIIAALAMGCAGGKQGQEQPTHLKFDTTAQGTTFSVEAQPLDTTDGYSYTISVNGRKFIHQTIIPVVEGFHHFETAEDALNTGKVVVFKMMNTSDMPALTTEDLVKLGILSQDGSIKSKK